MQTPKTKTSKLQKPLKHITLFGFFAITVAMTMDIHEYPVFATSGLQLIFFLVVGAILWFIPTALCAAELATVDTWDDGGIFVWVRNTLGKKLGFAAIFFQWLQVTVGFTAMLYFIVGIFADSFGLAALNESPPLKCLVATAIFWIMSLWQLRGSRHTVLINKVGTIAGIIIPAILMASLSIAYLASGGQSHVVFTTEALIPDFSKISTIVVFISFILSYMGIEASASYTNELKNPKRTYPIAILMVAVVAIILNVIGGLSIAITVPSSELSLNAGIIQSLNLTLGFFHANFDWLLKILTVMIATGVLSEISGWIIGPVRGLQQAATDGLLPEKFSKSNQHGVPTRLVIMQSIITTIWITIITLIGGGNNLSFLIAITITVVIYGAAYILMYAGYFQLIFQQKHLKRRFEVPGGQPIKILTAIIGLLTTLFCIIISFVPPNTLTPSEIPPYFLALIPTSILALSAPFIIYQLQTKNSPTKH
ncbi:MAG: amino acid permease [Candidatus Nomurabacteria bacterium]|jgi:glutamate:gamma-aminobutyrate antiporter|nr:amino acid permease [Candidatus Nomurabacteria bacterium]